MANAQVCEATSESAARIATTRSPLASDTQSLLDRARRAAAQTERLIETAYRLREERGQLTARQTARQMMDNWQQALQVVRYTGQCWYVLTWYEGHLREFGYKEVTPL